MKFLSSQKSDPMLASSSAHNDIPRLCEALGHKINFAKMGLGETSKMLMSRFNNLVSEYERGLITEDVIRLHLGNLKTLLESKGFDPNFAYLDTEKIQEAIKKHNIF